MFSGFSLANDLPKHDAKLLRPIRAIASEDSIEARAALNEINDILESPEKHAALRDYEDMYIMSICMQFKVNNLLSLPLNSNYLRLLIVALGATTYKRILDHVPAGVVQHVHVFHDKGAGQEPVCRLAKTNDVGVAGFDGRQ